LLYVWAVTDHLAVPGAAAGWAVRGANLVLSGLLSRDCGFAAMLDVPTPSDPAFAGMDATDWEGTDRAANSVATSVSMLVL
jgi:hypothetical protein